MKRKILNNNNAIIYITQVIKTWILLIIYNIKFSNNGKKVQRSKLFV